MNGDDIEQGVDQSIAGSEPLMMLSDEQKDIRKAVVQGVQENKTINLGRAMEGIFAPDERDFWTDFVNRFTSGEPVAPEDVRRFESLSIKIGLQEPKEAVQQPLKEPPEERPVLQPEIFDVANLTEEQIRQLGREQKQGYLYLYRGVIGPWKPPSLTQEAYKALQEEWSRGIERALTGEKFSPEEGQRMEELRNILTINEGDQWFSDNPRLALDYAKGKGSLVRIAVQYKDILPHLRESGLTPGGIGNNFLVPREWFLPKKS